MLLMIFRQHHRLVLSHFCVMPVVLVVVAILAAAPTTVSASLPTPPPPIAEMIPHNLTIHNDTRVDYYYWMKDRNNPAVIDYLYAENNYTADILEHTVPLQEELFQEIKGRMKKDDSSVPYLYKNYYYYRRYEEELEYPFYCRRKATAAGEYDAGEYDAEAEEEECVDVNEYAEGHSYYWMSTPEYNGNEDVAACAYDDLGRRIYTIFFLDAQGTTNAYPEVIENVTSNMAWAEDNQTLFYTKQHPETLRWYQIWRHTLGTDPATEDVLVYEEQDEEFGCDVSKSKSNAYVIISCTQTLRTEYRYIDAYNPTTSGDFRVFYPREGEHEHYIEHAGDYWYILTNDEAKNFRLLRTPVADTEDGSIANKTEWEELIPHRNDTLLWWFDVFVDHLVVIQRYEGLRQIRIIPFDDPTQEHYLDFGEPVYYASLGTNYQYNTSLVRYDYQSFSTPESVFDYDMNTRQRTLLKQDEVLDDSFSPSNYVSLRLYATAQDDGARIPISMVYKEDVIEDPMSGTNPLLQYGYGAYGSTLDATFSIYRLSLLDRGFIYVQAHIRGGYEMGTHWYEGGKLLNKMNTFTDFIDVGQYLVDEGYTSPEHLYCYGASAGGLLIGAVLNMAPHLYHGAVAGVPFVDVVTTMLDDSIPLTTGEWDEWGDPREPEYYEYMLSYSPYDQVSEQDYPNLLVVSGLHDSQVQYWEPTKWVAKLRAHKTDDNLLLLQTNMESGHSGASGRFEIIKEYALEYAFLLDLAGKGNVTTANTTTTAATTTVVTQEQTDSLTTIGDDGSITVEGSITVNAEGEEGDEEEDASSASDGGGEDADDAGDSDPEDASSVLLPEEDAPAPDDFVVNPDEEEAVSRGGSESASGLQSSASTTVNAGTAAVLPSIILALTPPILVILPF